MNDVNMGAVPAELAAELAAIDAVFNAQKRWPLPCQSKIGATNSVKGHSHRFRVARLTRIQTSAAAPKTTTAKPAVQRMSYIAIPKLSSCRLDSRLHQTYSERTKEPPPSPEAKSGFNRGYFQLPLPGRDAFHVSIVSGNHPWVRPIIASGSGSVYLESVPTATPMRAANSDRPRYVITSPPCA